MLARRALLLALAAVMTLPSVGKTQQARKVSRIGMLLSGSPSDADPMVAAFRQGLRALGYVEGQNIAIEPRWADVSQRLPALATELVQSKVDLIVTQGTPAAQAAKRATSTIPIVMATSGDPVAIGLVATLARPGGNITGQSILSPELGGKRLELLKEIVPGLSRIAVLSNPTNPSHAIELKAIEVAAKTLGVALQLLEARGPEDFESVFQAAASGRAGALFLLADPLTTTAHRARLATLAARSRLPSMYGLSGYAEAGGLINYGPNLHELFRHAATYIDKILKGARPAELPVEQPTRFELAINLKTAKVLGLTIPQSILLRADQVIQ
jgi:putative ABC transport system substrate-binding protein